MNKWQRKWERLDDKAQWTKRLIPNVKMCIDRRYGLVDYYMPQALTRHECFMENLHGFGQTDDDTCWYCGEVNTVEHTLYNCDRWTNERLRTELELGEIVTSQNMTQILMESETAWGIVMKIVTNILQTMDRNERYRQMV
ncbi:hypothetical protein NQ314_009169 [Rhamnusium bicolor]|uniref:Reverse transcriptase zinc-binding domain-containing protein n=1 Tax=Rhamnusium bicolor TaxID=1586634 RepID=A0AAV8Y2K5_9CUCU|nr:hypothetical protein NQ314_009169 [Rhamnusium bicolor]